MGSFSAICKVQKMLKGAAFRDLRPPNSLQNRPEPLPQNYSEMSLKQLLALLLFAAFFMARATAQNPITLSGKIQEIH